MRRTIVLMTACLLLLAVPAHAGDEPTVEELARMVLEGSDAEQAMVAKWLDKADREKLVSLFRAVRERRRGPPPLPAPKPSSDAVALVNMQVRFIDIPLDKLDVLLGPDRPSAESPSRLVEPAVVERLIRNLEATGGAQQVTAPRLTTYDGQKANVSVLNKITFIQDYDIEMGRGGKQIADPVVGVIQEGITLDLCATLTADRKAATVEFLGTWAVLQKPIKEKKITIGGQELTIQLPELDVARTEASIRMRDGGHALISGGMQLDVEGIRVERVALLHIKSWELDKDELPALEQELESEAEKARARAAADPELAEPLYELHTHLLFVPHEKLEELLGGRDVRETLHRLDGAEAELLLARARTDPGIEILAAMALTSPDGKPAQMQETNQVAYVREYEKEEKDGKVVLRPVIQTIQDGAVLELTPTRTRDKDVAVVEAKFTSAALERPIREAELEIEGRRLKTQHPELCVARSRAVAKMKDGSHILLRGPAPERFAKGVHVAIVRLKIGTVGEFVGAGARIKRK